MIHQIWLTTFLSELMRVVTKQTLWYVQQDRVVSENCHYVQCFVNESWI